MQGLSSRYLTGYNLIELMVVVAIAAALAVVAVGSYRQYIIRTNIVSLIALADDAKIAVEDAHNQGTLFGTTGSQTYIDASATDKPFALKSITRVNYGCVNIDLDLAALKLDDTKTLIITWCPANNAGSIEWTCGYDDSSFTDYLKYLPSDCQTVNTDIIDMSF